MHTTPSIHRQPTARSVTLSAGPMPRSTVPLLALLLLISTVAQAAPPSCAGVSGSTLPPVIELFTSEGCSSCPPADAWAGRASQEKGLAGTILLAEHVDYWDDLGWPDPYAQHAFSTRQQNYTAARHARGVYTPQVIVAGEELVDWTQPGGLTERAVRQAARPASVQLRVTVDRVEGDAVFVQVQTHAGASMPVDALQSARLTLALTEDGLLQQPGAGENRGRPLHHDGVVRVQATRPATDGSSSWVLHRAPGQDWHRSHLVALVQQGEVGTMLQALSVPLASCGVP